MDKKVVKGIIGGDDFLTEVLVRGLTVYGPADAYYVGNCEEKIGVGLRTKYGVGYAKNFQDFVSSSAVLFFAFKPEEANRILPKVAEKISSWTVIISLVEGLNIATLENTFPENEIVRLFVTPSIISGAGLGAYALSKNASANAEELAHMILKDCGDVIEVRNERELEEVADYLLVNTYLSYAVVQAMLKNAQQLGMNPKESNFAVNKLLTGAVHTLIDIGGDAGGTIARGLRDAKFREKVIDMLESCGLKDDLTRYLDKDGDFADNPDDPRNYKMHYKWSRTK